jgi:hypothetical protein
MRLSQKTSEYAPFDYATEIHCRSAHPQGTKNMGCLLIDWLMKVILIMLLCIYPGVRLSERFFAALAKSARFAQNDRVSV